MASEQQQHQQQQPPSTAPASPAAFLTSSPSSHSPLQQAHPSPYLYSPAPASPAPAPAPVAKGGDSPAVSETMVDVDVDALTNNSKNTDPKPHHLLTAAAAAAAAAASPSPTSIPALDSARTPGSRAPPPPHKTSIPFFTPRSKGELNARYRQDSKWLMLLDYLCCCVPRTKIARIICLAITFIVLLTLGLVGGFFWPRFPAIHVISINLANLANSYAFSLAPNSTNLNTMTVQLKLTMNISVYNDNLYDLDVEQMYIKAYLLVNTTEIAKHASPASLNIQSIIGPAPLNPDPNYRPSNTTLIGTGTKKTVTFPSKANVTFVMDFLLSYTPDSEVGLIKDPAFAEVMNVCGITSNRRPAEIGYVATSTVSKLSSIGYSPSVQNSVFIKCPVTELQVEQIQNDPEAKTDPFKVLQKVLGNGTVVITTSS